MPFIIGRKVEMTQQFKDDGTVVPVTLIKAEPNIVTQIREEARDGYVAVQIGSEVTTKSLVKSEAGHLQDLPQLKTLREFRVAGVPENYVRGTEIRVSDFVPGTKVDIVGVSKGRGFAGVMKRHHFAGSKATHGNKDQQRMGGSIGSQRQGKVIKGQRMGGHMGDVRVTVKNLEVVSFDADKNLLAVKGAIPGARGGLILVRSHERKQLWQ
ncbi:MAG: 50S ribosomal protein L3 [Candidatus Uhrbacteria bacterium]|nr:50S ribosomal protein L3 [Candidatus Uhrbacteria bacterium]